jgi:hypothetical protein
METYFELRHPDGTSQKLEGVGTLDAAKASFHAVTKITNAKGVKLVKVTEVDPNAPARTRGTSAEAEG